MSEEEQTRVMTLVCIRGERLNRCKCGRGATKRCAYPTMVAGVPGTCVAHVCDRCASGPERTLCPPHGRYVTKQKDAVLRRPTR